jgi:acetylornithine deacetylase
LIDWLSAYLDSFGVEHMAVSAGRQDAADLYAALGPRNEEGLLLAGHTDVVDMEGQAWTSDPFELRRADGRLYGRGRPT